jgi:hypothetical protein
MATATDILAFTGAAKNFRDAWVNLDQNDPNSLKSFVAASVGLSGAIAALTDGSPALGYVGAAGSLLSLADNLRAYNTAVEFNDVRAQVSLTFAIASDVAGAGAGVSALLTAINIADPLLAGPLAVTTSGLTVISVGATGARTLYDANNQINDWMAKIDFDILKGWIEQDDIYRGIINQYGRALISGAVTAANAAESGNAVKLSAGDTPDGPTLVLGFPPDSSGAARQIVVDPQAGTAIIQVGTGPGVTVAAGSEFSVSNEKVRASTFDDNGALEKQQDVFTNGTTAIKYLDPKNTHLYNELDVTKAPDGKVTAAQIVPDQRFIDAGASIGQIFGSALGSLLGGKDQLTRLASNVVGGTIGSLIGQKFGLVVATSMAADLSKVSLVDVFASKNINIADAGLGAVSSFLSAELGNALQIPGFGGQLFNAATNSFTLSVLTQVKNSIVDGLTFDAAIAAIDWSAAVSGVIANTPAMAGNVIGTFLGQLLVPAKSHAGEIGGQLLGAIGSFLLPGVGSLIGTILGTVIGDLFGHTSHPAATDLLDQAGDHYAATHYQTSSSDGGAFSVPDQMADPALAIINGYLNAVNGAVLDHSKQVTIGYQTAPQSSYIVGVPSHPAAGVFFATGYAVQAAAVDVLQHLEVIGGDLLLKRGHHNSSFYNPPPMPPADPSGDPGPTGAPIQPIATTQLAILSADLAVAQDYENYLNNREAINALMAANHVRGRAGRAHPRARSRARLQRHRMTRPFEAVANLEVARPKRCASIR